MAEDIAQYNMFTTLDLKYTAFEVNGKQYQFIHLPFGIMNGVSAFQRCINSIIDKKKLSDTFVFVGNMTMGKPKKNMTTTSKNSMK